MIINMTNEHPSTLAHRLKPALISALLAIFAISCAGEPDLYLLPAMALSALTIMASRELHAITNKIGLRSNWLCSLSAALLPQMTLWWFGTAAGWTMVLGLLLAFLLPVLWLMRHMFKDHSVFAVALHAMYLGAPMMLIYSMFMPKPASQIAAAQFDLALLLCAVKGTDMGGFFIGKAFGRTRLCPQLSPGKTWEGSAGGILFAQALVTLLCMLWNQPHLYESLLMLWTAVAVISVSSQIGDLAESYLKRLAGVKDSGSLPGLGGILDIADSILLSVVVFWILKGAGWI